MFGAGTWRAATPRRGLGRLVQPDDAGPEGYDEGLGATLGAEPFEQGGDVKLHGALPDPEGEGDLLVRATLGDVAEDVTLTRR